MIRGTNAQFKFKLPYSYSKLSVVEVAFWQHNQYGNNEILIIKTKASCALGSSNRELLVTLGPAETLKFSDQKKAYVQLRASTEDGHVFASKQQLIKVYPVCDDSILGDEDVDLPPPVDDGWVYLDGGTIT